jgi:hypothetical protein
MTDIKNLEKRYAKRFRKGNPLEVYFGAFDALLKNGQGTEVGLRTAARWMRKHGRPVSRNKVKGLLGGLMMEGPDLPTTYLLFSLVRSSAEHRRHVPLQTFVLLSGRYAELSPPGHPSGEFLLREAKRCLETYPESDARHQAIADVQMRYATQLLQKGDATLRHQGLELMRAAVDALRELHAKGTAASEETLAKALHNLGEAHLRVAKHTGDKSTRQVGIQFLEESASFPTRRQDPRPLELTLRSLGIGWKQQAEASAGDAEEALALLDKAEKALEEAASVVREAGPRGVDCPVAAKQSLVNIRLFRASLQRRIGRLSEDEAGSEVVAAAKWGIRVLASVPEESLSQESRNALRNYHAVVDGAPSIYETGREVVRLHRRWRDRCDESLDELEASSLAQLLAPAPLGTLDDEQMAILVELLGAARSRNLSLHSSRALVIAESRAFYEWASSGTASGETLVGYWTRRVADLRNLCRGPLASGMEKRTMSAWLRNLVLARLRAPQGAELPPAEWLSMVDLAGAMAFRADLEFFGQGQLASGGEIMPADEATARASAYRDRATMDLWSNAIAIDELREARLGTTTSNAMDSVRQSLGNSDPMAHIMDISSGRPEPSGPKAPRAELEAYRRGLAHVIDSFPGIVRTAVNEEQTAVSSQDTVRGWFEGALGNTILVSVDDGHWSIAYWHRGDIRLHDFGPREGSPEHETVSEALETFFMYLVPTISAPPPPELEAEALGQIEDELIQELGEKPSTWDSFVARLIPLAGQKLGALLDALTPTGNRLQTLIRNLNLTSATLLERGMASHIPWEAIPVDQADGSRAPLCSLTPIVRSHTLATNSPGLRWADGTLNYVSCAPESASPLQCGRAVFGPSATFHAGVPGRYEVESSLSGKGVARFFSHGVFQVFPSDSSGLVLDEQAPDPLWQVTELRALDLRACSRVELWACETTFSMDLEGMFFEHEEPTGVAPAFLLSGAGCVLGARWKTPAFSAALIADALGRLLPGPASSVETARALAEAIVHYRRLIAPDGVVDTAMQKVRERHLAESGTKGDRLSKLLGNGFHAARIDLWEHLGGEEPEPLSDSLEDHVGTIQFLGQVKGEQLTQLLGRELDEAVESTVDFLRGPMAWAGWRVYVAGLREEP